MLGISSIDFKRLHLFEDLFDQNTVKTTIKKTCIFFYNVIYSCNGKAEFSASLPQSSELHNPKKNHSNMLI